MLDGGGHRAVHHLVVQVRAVLQQVAGLQIAIRVQAVHVAMMIVQVAHAVLILIVRHVRVVMMTVHQHVVASVIVPIVQVVRVVMMIVHAVLMIVQRVRKPMRSVVPIKFVHAQVAVATIAMQHRVTIISKSVGTMKVQHVRHAVDRAAVTTMHQSIWSVTRSVHQHQRLHT